MFIASPAVAMLCQRCPRQRRLANFVGLAILASALVAASFTNTTGALLATQGVLFAVGGLTMYFPAMYVIGKLQPRGWCLYVSLTDHPLQTSGSSLVKASHSRSFGPELE